MLKRLALWFGGAVAFLGALWVVDVPQTVRLKAAIVNATP
jgi:hypothetical protein